jgi:4-diphosphocytidyl-2-C-methyl-D-erythritol kinase
MSDGISTEAGWSIEAGRATVLSPAKVNWTLRVIGKRSDGFHEIQSLVSPVTLYDRLAFVDTAESGFVLECQASGVPTDDSNLINRAARLLAAKAGRRLSGRCVLTKQIPIGGGLGGGSSNAATTLVALNRLWGLNWPKTQLAELAAELGSDVMLFLENGSAVIGGRGETVEPVELGWHGWIVLIMPGLHVSTPAVYRAWQKPGGEVGPVQPKPTSRAIEWMEQTFNMLEPPAIAVCPRLGVLQRQAAEIAGRPVRVSGSGSTMFAAFDTLEQAVSCGKSLDEGLKIRTEVVQPLDRT